MDALALFGLGPRLQFHELDRMHGEIAAVHGGLLNAVPVALAILNEFWQVLFTNLQFNALMKLQDSSSALGQRLGEICGCDNARTSLSGCGTSLACPGCSVFKAVYRVGLEEGLGVSLVLPVIGAVRVSVGWGAPMGSHMRVCAFFPA